MFYHCIFLIYILLSHFTVNNGHKIRRGPLTGGMAYMDYDGIMRDYDLRWFPRRTGRKVKNCHNNAATQKLPCNVSDLEPCSYPCNKIVLTPKNMTKELQTTIDMSPSKKVVSAQEILLVPRCPCSDNCASKENATYSFDVIDFSGTPDYRSKETYTIHYCVQC